MNTRNLFSIGSVILGIILLILTSFGWPDAPADGIIALAVGLPLVLGGLATLVSVSTGVLIYMGPVIYFAGLRLNLTVVVFLGVFCIIAGTLLAVVFAVKKLLHHRTQV